MPIIGFWGAATGRPASMRATTTPPRRSKRGPEPADVLRIVADCFPQERIPVKTHFLIKGLFEEGRI